ncbi:MAG TPA: hypothetical protein [Caudoviricetes sp.]|nr:MAG TPA: hypothetical protein [Caudoviricetes sp.]
MVISVSTLGVRCKSISRNSTALIQRSMVPFPCLTVTKRTISTSIDNHLSHFLYILYHKNFFMSTCRRGEVIRRAMKIFVL